MRADPRDRVAGRTDAAVIYRAAVLLVALAIAALAFRQVVAIALVTLLAVILALPLAELATRLERIGVPRTLGAALGLLAGLGALTLVGWLVLPPLVSEARTLIDQFPARRVRLREQLQDVAGVELESVVAGAESFVRGFLGQGGLLGIAFDLFAVLGGALLVLLTALYVAAKPQPLVDGLLSLAPPASRPRAQRILDRLRSAWLSWLWGTVIAMVSVGLALYLGLLLVGLEHALVFAVLAAVLEFIPYLGPFLAAVPTVGFALTVSVETALLVLVVFLAVQQLEGNVIVPLVMKRALGLHPAFVAVGVVTVGVLFGIVGLFVAVPLLIAAVILVDELWVRRHDPERAALGER